MINEFSSHHSEQYIFGRKKILTSLISSKRLNLVGSMDVMATQLKPVILSLNKILVFPLDKLSQNAL